MDKLKRLKSILKKMGSVCIAFSGGSDSTFLLKIACLVLPENKLLAVTASSATYPEEELRQAKLLAGKIGARHKIIRTRELRDKKFIANPVNRCYFCKYELFRRLEGLAGRLNLKFVADGSTMSDGSDFRPGNLAKKEWHIRSPLAEAHLSKEDIRRLSRSLGLSTWNKPAEACLASRIPYGVRISHEVLGRIHNAEAYLKKTGLRQVRLRHYNGLCRIEVSKNEMARLLRNRQQVVDKFKKLGYNYVTMDLEGYRTGSMNEVFLKRGKT